MGELLVIGVGSDFRGDDAAGLLAARRLATVPGLHAVEHRGDAVTIFERWQPTDRVVVVDALRSGDAPGTVFRFDATGTPVPADAGWLSTHAPGLAEGIETARALGRLPASLTVYGIEAGSVEPGAPVTPEVARAVAEVAHTIVDRYGP